MTNILDAIANIVNNPISNILERYQTISDNRINAVGDALEEFIKDAFAGTIHETDSSIKLKKYNRVFSWLGNQNNPPDLILRNGDAIEVKKIASLRSQIALNSSYPKDKLLSSDAMIASDCRNCEKWEEKDLIYIIGVFQNKQLKLLWMIYGSCYAAQSEYYTRIKNKISDGINEIQNVEFAETKELGRVNKVDPLGITYLRIRGMWGIDNPINVYNYLNIDIKNDSFQLIAIIPEDKFLSFEELTKKRLTAIKENKINISSATIKSPNNPAQLMNVKIINYKK